MLAFTIKLPFQKLFFWYLEISFRKTKNCNFFYFVHLVFPVYSTFSLTQPSGPSQSSSCDVRVSVCPLHVKFILRRIIGQYRSHGNFPCLSLHCPASHDPCWWRILKNSSLMVYTWNMNIIAEHYKLIAPPHMILVAEELWRTPHSWCTHETWTLLLNTTNSLPRLTVVLPSPIGQFGPILREKSFAGR